MKYTYCLQCMSHIQEGMGVCPYCGGNPRGQQVPHGLRPGTLLRGQYLVGNVVGEGGFGITYVGRDIVLDMKIAVKEFFPFGFATRNNTASNVVTWSRNTQGGLTEGDLDKLLMEAQSIAKFHSDSNIVDVRNYFKENNTAYIIMEYLDGMNVSQRISMGGPLRAEEAFRLFLPLMDSLQGMHRQGIIHRDISPNNVRLLGDGRLKLMDFGSARYYQGGPKNISVQYKEGFTPLEQRTSGGQQGSFTDVYSLCATLYYCITGKVPVDALDRLQHDSLPRPSSLGVSITSSLENVLMYGLAIYPDHRCRDMAELKSLTERALGNKAVQQRAGSSAMEADVYKTEKADARSKRGISSMEEMGKDGYLAPPVTSRKKKKGKGLLIALPLLALALGGMYFLWQQSSPSKVTESTQSSQEEMEGKEEEKAALATGKGVEEEAEQVEEEQVEVEPETEETTATTKKKKKKAKAAEDSKEASETEAEKETKQEAETESEVGKEAEEMVTVPDFRGKKLTDVYYELGTLGLKAETTYEETREVAEDYVIRQSVEEGRSLKKGETLMLYVAKAPAIEAEPQTNVEAITYTEPTPVPAATFFTQAFASSTLPDEGSYNYSPVNVLDNNNAVWCEGSSGAGVGEWIQLNLPGPRTLNSLRFINGYAGTEKQYISNGKIRQLRITFSNGESTLAYLNVLPAERRFEVQEVYFSQPVVTEYVRLTILDVETAQYLDTCLTYVGPN